MASSRLPSKAGLPGMAPDKVHKGKAADHNPADAATTFPQFRQLPAEIQLLIWKEAAASPVLTPGYALFNDMLEAIDNFDHDKHDVDLQQESPVMANLMVLTSWSPLMHTCIDSRRVALDSPALGHLFSRAAGFAVPYRRFDMAIDYLYISDGNELREAWEAGTGITFPAFRTLPAEKLSLFPNEVKCVMPLPTMWEIKHRSVVRSLYTIIELRDVHGVAMHPSRGFFDPCAPIVLRERMQMAQTDEFHEGCVIELLMKKFYKARSRPARLTPRLAFI